MKTHHSTHRTVHHNDGDHSVKKLDKALATNKGGNENVVVKDKQKDQAKAFDSGEPRIDRTAKEDGHGGGKVDNSPPPPSAAQLEFERKTKEREDVIKQNASIKESNRGLNEQVSKLETAKTHLTALANIFDISASFTRGELKDFANSLTLKPEEKAAARWLLAQDDAALAALGVEKDGGGVTKESINAALGSMEGKIAELKAQIRPELPVPGDPTPPPPTSSTTGTGGASGNGAAPTNGSAPTKTPEQANAEMFPSFSQLPEFSSSATTGEGRMQDGANHLQKSLDALEKDLAAAAATGNQAAMTAINNKISKLQAGMSALMQMMKQRQEMESNMAKMFSEMAMSSIRNMR